MIKKQEDERESEEKEDVVKVDLWNLFWKAKIGNSYGGDFFVDINGEEYDDEKYDDEEFDDDCAGNGETSRREPAAETILLCEDGMILIFIIIIITIEWKGQKQPLSSMVFGSGKRGI